ncbi:MAG: hypothetical protein CVV44_00325 [Spirochaetae bacterium HGW-Spirochaetae-1]|jgi:hypothetical protein|nr:MAG: hypothetical protein CVV44_00325 [Spirochaetae bacterium HGW-Spirochaetae-1]
MKKFVAVAMVLSFGILFSLTACGGSKMGGTVKGETFKTEGWIDENTYRIAAAGVPTRTLTNQVQRREAAKRAAILNAQYQVLEKFKGSKIEGAAGMSNFEMTGIAIAQEIQGTIKGGSVYKVTYDAEDNCEIIYEVKAKGLKKKVSAADWE